MLLTACKESKLFNFLISICEMRYSQSFFFLWVQNIFVIFLTISSFYKKREIEREVWCMSKFTQYLSQFQCVIILFCKTTLWGKIGGFISNQYIMPVDLVVVTIQVFIVFVPFYDEDINELFIGFFRCNTIFMYTLEVKGFSIARKTLVSYLISKKYIR